MDYVRDILSRDEEADVVVDSNDKIGAVIKDENDPLGKLEKFYVFIFISLEQSREKDGYSAHG